MLHRLSMLVLALAALPSPARADSPHAVHLVYERGEGAEACPDESGLRDAIAARIGYDPVRADADLTIRIELRRVGTTLEAQVRQTRGEDEPLGQRRLTAGLSECRELIDALALEVTLTLDSSKPAPPAAQEGVTPAPEPAAVSAPPADTRVPVTSAPRLEAEAPRPEAPTRIVVAAGLAVTAGLLPRPAPGVVAAVRLQWRRASLGVEGLASLPSSFAFDGGSIGTSLLAGALVGCLHEGWLSGCAVGTSGSLHASSRGYLGATEGSALYLAAGLRAQLEVPVGKGFAVHVHAGLLAPLVRSELLIDQSAAWTSPVVSFDSGLALMHTFE